MWTGDKKRKWCPIPSASGLNTILFQIHYQYINPLITDGDWYQISSYNITYESNTLVTRLRNWSPTEKALDC